MFGKTNETPVATKTNTNSSNLTFIADDCEFNGTIVSKGSARIDGRVEGIVNVAGDLVIGQSASLKADLQATTISIAGEIHGNVKAKELLELSSTARLYGDINTKQLKIDQGARFIGSSTYEEEPIPTPAPNNGSKEKNGSKEQKENK